jgi:drug/metabolite transporter (DMT)-like permease
MPVLFLILACVLWAVSFPIVKALHLEQTARLPAATPAFLAAWIQFARFSLAALVLLPVVARMPRPTRKEWTQGIWLAVWGGLGMALQADALAYTEASTSAFLTQAYCVILPLIACARLKKAPSLRVIVATILVMAGGAILAGLRLDSLKLGRGEQETLLAAFIFTGQILTLENPKYAGNRGTTVTFTMCLAIGLLFLPIAAWMAPHVSDVVTAGASWPSFVLVAALALFCSVGAYGLMNTWQPRVPATEAGLIYTTEPVFTACMAMFLPGLLGRLTGREYPNETLTLSLFAGGSLIVAANLLMQWKRPPHEPAIAPAP